LQRLLERVFNHHARNIGGFLCAPNLYSACWRCSKDGHTLVGAVERQKRRSPQVRNLVRRAATRRKVGTVSAWHDWISGGDAGRRTEVLQVHFPSSTPCLFSFIDACKLQFSIILYCV
jgi:hypothetical protein